MPGLKSSPTCTYCGKVCKTFAGIGRHIAQQPVCAAKRLKERNRRARNIPTSRCHTQIGDAGLRDRRPRPALADPAFRSPSVTLEELEDEDAAGYRGGSPRRNPNAILEEVDNEEFEVEMRAASRGQDNNPHEEDDHVQELPYHGPHPFANPTRAGLFPEPHPDPTAGVPLEYHEVDRDAPPKYTSVLAEPDVFREAYWLDHLPICRDDEAEFFSLPRTRGWFCKNLTEFEQEVNRLPRGPRWYRETILVTGDQDDEILDLWKRDIVEMIKMLLRDPRFIPHTRYAPERHYRSETKQDRVYDEMWSGRWWWRMQNILGRYATVVPIIISTDKTKLTVFSGNQKAWPVYLSIGNINSDIRRCPSERAMLLIGYIPVSNLSNISNRSTRSEAGWQLFHTCLESILEPLKTLSRTGIEILCADGGVRRVFPILAAYIADSPEQATVACVRESCCPVCWVPSNERGDLSVRYPLRDRRRTCDALNDCWNGYSRTINTLGIRPTRPFWADLPYVEISTCFTPDLLHQLDKGVFGDHIVGWTKAMLGTNEMDRRTKGMPRFHDLRHFSRGMSVISMWTGKEAKALSRTFMSIVAGAGRPMLVAAAKSILNFMFRAHQPELSEADLRTMEQDLLAFNEVKNVFVDPNNRLLLSHERRFHGFIKFHSLTHYRYFIRELGSPQGFTTEMTERLHIDYVKKPWSTTNHVNATQQMIAHLQNREAWALLRAYMHDTGLVVDQRFRDEHNRDDGREDEGPEDIVQCGDADDGGRAWEPSPSIGIAKRPSLGANVRGAYLIKNHNAPDLVPATIDYLRSVVPAGTSIPISYNTVFKAWTRCKLHHPPLPFDPALGPRTDQLRAFTTSSDPEGRILRQGFFDVVLFSPHTPPANLQGLQRFEVGRVRAIFALPNHHGSLSSEPLVYIERFRPFGNHPSSTTSLYQTRHAFYDGRRSAVVLPLSQIRVEVDFFNTQSLGRATLNIELNAALLARNTKLRRIRQIHTWTIFLASVCDRAFFFLPSLSNMPTSRYDSLNDLDLSIMPLSPNPGQFLQFATNPTPTSPLPYLLSVSSLVQKQTSLEDSNDTALSRPPTSSMPTTQFDPSMHPNTRARNDGCRLPVTDALSNSRSSHDLVGNVSLGIAAGGAHSRFATSFLGRPTSRGRLYGSTLVHRQRQNPNARSTVQRAPSESCDESFSLSTGMRVPDSDEECGAGHEAHDKNSGPSIQDIRLQQIEAEQRRRNNLRTGFARLKDALPTSHKKCSKVILLERATTYIAHLEAQLRVKQDPERESGPTTRN
ncbi:helix loop helix DNA-binding domain protein [Ceratobasidium sp. AG-Ba]|nr:helix loop helix DNA-binding domain protein [Ceratobasidium sp. AG-Ba]